MKWVGWKDVAHHLCMTERAFREFDWRSLPHASIYGGSAKYLRDARFDLDMIDEYLKRTVYGNHSVYTERKNCIPGEIQLSKKTIHKVRLHTSRQGTGMDCLGKKEAEKGSHLYPNGEGPACFNVFANV